jgi:hypothetical protein
MHFCCLESCCIYNCNLRYISNLRSLGEIDDVIQFRCGVFAWQQICPNKTRKNRTSGAVQLIFLNQNNLLGPGTVPEPSSKGKVPGTFDPWRRYLELFELVGELFTLTEVNLRTYGGSI